MTETKFKVGDLIESKIRGKPVIVTRINNKEHPITYTMTNDMKEFITVYADWVEENMVLCEH